MRDYAYMGVQQSALTCTGTYMTVLSEAYVHRCVKMDCHTKMYMHKKTAVTSVLQMKLLCIRTFFMCSVDKWDNGDNVTLCYDISCTYYRV